MMLCRDVRQDINNRIRKESIMRKIISLLLTACLAAALLTGCGGKASEGGAAAKKTMVIGATTFNSGNWVETVAPHRTYNGWACIRYGIGETLVHYTDAMEQEPWLATDWTNDGGCTWTITLRDGVKFSSGRDMDGEAVKQCLNHLLENHDRAPSDTKIVDVAADGQVLTVTTSEPNPALMNYLGDPYGCIIDVDASDFENGIVVGTGPYVVKELVTDDHLTLTPNTRYWNGTPKLDELTIRTLSNGDTLSAALQAGDIDAAYGMAYEAYPIFENGGYTILSCILKLKKGNYDEIKALMADYNKRRSDKQPLSHPSAGSTFKRPEGYFAGKSIQDAGLMGYSVGGAMVSDKHAGYVVNKGGATAKED